MEFLFYGCGNQGDVSWLSRSGEDSKGVETDFRESKTPKLQWPGDYWNCFKPFFRCAVRDRFCAFASFTTRLLPRQRRGPANPPTKRGMGEPVNCALLHRSNLHRET